LRIRKKNEKTKHRLRWLLTIMFLLPLVGDLVVAQELVVVGDNSYPPYSFVNDQGEAVGICVDLWSAFSAKTGITVEYIATEWSKALEMISTGKADVVDTIFYDKERAQWLAFTKPYAEIEVRVFFKENLQGITGLETLSGFVVGAKRGDRSAEIAKSLNPNISLRYFDSYEQLVKAASEDTVRVFVMDMPPAQYYLAKFELYDSFKSASRALSKQFLYRAVREDDESLVDIINSGFDKIDTSEVSKIYEKWMGMPVFKVNWKYIFYIAAVFVGILLVVMLWNTLLRRKIRQAVQNAKKQQEELLGAYDQLRAANFELESAYLERDKLLGRLKTVISLADELLESRESTQEQFLSHILEKALYEIPTANYGSISVTEGGVWKFVCTAGHNIEKLNKLNLKSHMMVLVPEVSVVEDWNKINQVSMNQNTYEQFSSAVKPVKSSLVAPLRTDKGQIGNLALDIAKESKEIFSSNDIEVMRAFASLTSVFLKLHEYERTKKDISEQIIFAMVRMMELYDNYTKGHSMRVAKIALEIGRLMNLSEHTIKNLYWAGLVHDIGKLLIPKRILNKKDALSDEEYETVKKHTVWGYEVLNSSPILREIAVYVLHHHEHWDGTGYPDHLEKDQIELVSRIISVADSFEAMVSDRAYRKAFSVEYAFSEIESCSGSQFDPAVVRVFVYNKHRILERGSERELR